MPEAMSLAGLQKRLERFDAERGWDVVDPAHTALHLLEELGEVARELLVLSGYKTPDDAAKQRLEAELADVTLLLCKLASHHGIDLERAARAKLLENEARFPLETSKAALKTYLERQHKD